MKKIMEWHLNTCPHPSAKKHNELRENVKCTIMEKMCQRISSRINSKSISEENIKKMNFISFVFFLLLSEFSFLLTASKEKYFNDISRRN